MKKIILSILTICLIGSLCACGASKEPVQPESEEQLSKISTPYAELCVPAYFDGNVTNTVVNENPYTLEFAANDGTALFSLVFNGKGEVLMGTLEGDDENTVIYMNLAEFDKDSENFDIYVNYQDAVNIIMHYLEKDYNFHINEGVVTEDDSTMDIQTSVVTMKYPEKWKDKVTVAVYADRVKFTDKRDGTPLFDLVFDFVEEGFLLGTYDGTPITIVDYVIDNQEQIEMQDDVNVIIENLMDDPLFEINH